MITVTNLIKKFQMGDTELTALKNLSFTIPEKQFLAITGRSGSGKSTLLYQLGLLDRPDSGTILIGNQNVTQLNEAEQVIFRRNNYGFIFQDYALLPLLTAKENVMLPLLMQEVDSTKAKQRAIETLEKVGLAGRTDNLPNQLSGGQQQRVSIARAIVHDPNIIFADEPTANLDTESSKLILDIFLQLNKEGKTIVMVTHEPEYALLAQRDIELLDGTIIKDSKVKKGKR